MGCQWNTHNCKQLNWIGSAFLTSIQYWFIFLYTVYNAICHKACQILKRSTSSSVPFINTISQGFFIHQHKGTNTQEWTQLIEEKWMGPYSQTLWEYSRRAPHLAWRFLARTPGLGVFWYCFQSDWARKRHHLLYLLEGRRFKTFARYNISKRSNTKHKQKRTFSDNGNRKEIRRHKTLIGLLIAFNLIHSVIMNNMLCNQHLFWIDNSKVAKSLRIYSSLNNAKMLCQ